MTARWLAGAIALALSASALARAASVEERIAALESWQETPLDLAEAAAEEIALLPGLDGDLAEAVVALRELGEMRTVIDLERIPGLDAAAVEALRPYVTLAGGSQRAGANWFLSAQRRSEVGPVDWRRRFTAVEGGWRVDGAIVDAEERRWRGGARGDVFGLVVTAGDLVLDLPSGLCDTGAGRTRFGPARVPSAARIRGRTDSAEREGWTGIGVSRGTAMAFAGRSPAGLATGAGVLELGDQGRRARLAFRVGGGAAAGAVSLSRKSGVLATWTSVAVERDVRAVSLGVRVRGPRWRVGLDASDCDSPLEFGSDPVTGHRRDRAHRVVQAHGRVRASRWTVSGIWREVNRGLPGQETSTGAAELELAWRPDLAGGADRVAFVYRTAPVRRGTLTVRRRTGRAELRLRFSRESDGQKGTDLAGIEGRWRKDPFRVRLTLAGVEGNSSRPWMLTRPGAGIYPVWLRPPGVLVSVGAGIELPRWTLGAWLWGRADDGRSFSRGMGLAVSIRAGRMVRRLQRKRIAVREATRSAVRARPRRPKDVPAQCAPH